MLSTNSLFLPILLLSACSVLATLDFNDQFIKSPTFIDKSELFLELFRQRYDEPAFVTFPPKFGKSTNLQMLKKLIQFELDFKDQAKPIERTSAYHLVQNLKLSKHKDAYSEHLAQHPVILLDLKYQVEGEINHDNLVAGLKKKIREIFEEYEWLSKKLQKSGHPRSDFFQNALKSELSAEEISDSLLVLSEVLYGYFNQSKVVFLVDDFDYVSKYDFDKHYVTDSLYSIIYVMILKVTKSPYCHKRSLILSVSDRKVEAPLYGNIRQFSFLEEDSYAPHFGILSDELDLLFERHQCSEKEKKDVKKWYDGYRTNLVYRPIYNTYSIIEYFRHRNESNALRPYWAAVQDTQFIRKFLRVPFFRMTFNELLRSDVRVFHCNIRKRRLLADKKFLPNITDDKKDFWMRIDGKFHDLIGLLFEQGYISHRNYIKDVCYNITNWEIENLMVGLAMEFYQNLNIPVTKLSKDIMHILNETDNSTNYFQAGVFEWSISSIVLPIQKAGFISPLELEHFNVIHLAAMHIKMTVPGTEVILKRMSCHPREDILITSNNKAMIINFDRNPNRVLSPDESLCRCVRDRNFTIVKFLAVTLDDAKVKCEMRTVDCRTVKSIFSKISSNWGLFNFYARP